jgi:hypothetical protein
MRIRQSAEIVLNRSLDRARNVARHVPSLIMRDVTQYFRLMVNRHAVNLKPEPKLMFNSMCIDIF